MFIWDTEEKIKKEILFRSNEELQKLIDVDVLYTKSDKTLIDGKIKKVIVENNFISIAIVNKNDPMTFILLDIVSNIRLT